MSFIEDFKAMVDGNVDVGSWVTCAQQDTIGENTKFIISAAEINNGMMCCGDGEQCGEWTWFNDMNDLYDYLLNLAIPLNLCMLEDQDPMLALNAEGNRHLFNCEYSEENVAVKDDIKKLYDTLLKLRERNAGYDEIKKALLESNKRCEDTYGGLIFRFYCFDNYHDAGKELLKMVSLSDGGTDKIVSEILFENSLNADAAKALARLFIENGIL